jgi:putative transposase
MNIYPRRLHHEVPPWVKEGSRFHIRLRVDRNNGVLLTSAEVGPVILSAVRHYQKMGNWHCDLAVLMPDHLHALLSFPNDTRMSVTISQWKRFLTRQLGIDWQSNYFDHRLRSDSAFSEKYEYILRNPVVKGLCREPSEWTWKFEYSAND